MSAPSVHAVVHGGPDHAELAALGLRPEEVIEFSANVNPYGPPPGVAAAIRRAAIDRYPDRDCLALREALAARANLPIDHLICGNGEPEPIHLLGQVCLTPGATVVIGTPTFGEYAHAARLHGAEVIERAWALPLGGGGDLTDLLATVHAARPRLVWLCSPNNPTGDCLTVEQARALLAATATVGGYLVIDEAYADLQLDDTPADLTGLLTGPDGDWLVLLRSLTKGYALAGLRLGYLIAAPTLIADLREARPPWNVSAHAQAAGLAALAGDDHLERSRQRLRRTKTWLAAALRHAGYPVVAGVANWLLVEVGDAGATRRRLLQQGLLVRDCTSFGLPRHIRVSIRRPSECRRLVAALGGGDA